MKRDSNTNLSKDEITKKCMRKIHQDHFQKHSFRTSLAVIFNASQSTLGRTFCRKIGLYSISDCSSSASLKWSGKESEELLHALTAHVRKFTVSIFIFEISEKKGNLGHRCWSFCSRGRLGILDGGVQQDIKYITKS